MLQRYVAKFDFIANRFAVNAGKGAMFMNTIKDVARLAGVSPSTISKFMNGGNVREENAKAIRDAIVALDYRVNPFARSLKTQRSRVIGILLPDISAPFFGTVVTSLDKVLREHGYHTLISCYSANHALERDNLRYLISTGVDGLVYIPEDLSADEFYELTANYSIPTVQIDRIIQGVACDAVLVNNADAVYAATEALIHRGHRRIGLISGPKSVWSAKERQVGFLRALSDHDILFDEELFFSDEHSFATGHQGCEALLALENKPTAILSTNYDITIGLVTAIRDLGLHIPEDIDVFGFDCLDVCTMMKPPIPVIFQPEQMIGQTAANYLIERLNGYVGEPRITRLECKIIPEQFV